MVLVPVVPAPPLPTYHWSVGIDALFLERSSGGSIPLGYTAPNPNPNQTIDNLYSDDVLFPEQAGLRLQISRQLDANKSIDATYWGLQQWSGGRQIYGDPVEYSVLAWSPWLQIPYLPSVQGLDNYLGYNYSSQVENVEIGERLRLNPYDPYWTLNWLWGARYFYLSEHFNLSGADNWSGDSESLDSKTLNNLIGMQLGLQLIRGWDRCQFEVEGKAGMMANIYHQHKTDSASDAFGEIPDGFHPQDYANNGTDLSGLFELSLAARYRLGEYLWLRAGYQVYCITGLAMAPRQLGGFGHGGTLTLDGVSLGLESTW